MADIASHWTAAGPRRDLIIRGLADKLQQRAQGGPTRALQRRLRILAGELRGSVSPCASWRIPVVMGYAAARF